MSLARAFSLAVAVLLGCSPPPPAVRPAQPSSCPAAAAAPAWPELRVEAGQPQPRALPPGALGRLGSGRLVDAWGQAFALAPDGRLIASAGDDVVTIWDPSTGLRRAQPSCAGEALGIAFDRSGRSLRVLTRSRLCQLEMPGARRRGELPLEAVLDGEVSLDGTRALVLRGPKEKTRLVLLDAASGKLLREHRVPACQESCRVLLSPEAEWAGLALEGKLLLVELSSGRRIEPSLEGEPGGTRYYLRGLGPRGRPLWALAEGSEGAHGLREWPTPGAAPRTPEELASDTALVTDGRWLFAQGSRSQLPPSALDGEACLLQRDLAGGKPRCLLVQGDPTPVASDAGRLLVRDGWRLRIWDIAAGRAREHPAAAEAGHAASVRLSRLLADGQTLITLANDRVLRRWNRGSGRLLGSVRLPGPAASIWEAALAFPGDGRFVLARDDRRAVMADWSGRTEVLPLVKNEDALAVAVAPAGDRLVVISERFAHVFAPDGGSIATIPVPFSTCTDGCPVRATFSGDGRLLAVGVFSDEKSEVVRGLVVVLDLKNRALLRRLSIPSTARNPEWKGDSTTAVMALAFDAAARELAVAVDHERSRVLRFELASGRLIGGARTRIDGPRQLSYRGDELWVEAEGKLAVLAPNGAEKRCLEPAKGGGAGSPAGPLFTTEDGPEVHLWPARACAAEVAASRPVAPPPRCPALPERRYPDPRWTAAVEAKDLAAVPALLARPLEDSLRIPFYDHEKDEQALDRKTPRTCAEYLAIYDGGRTEYYGGRLMVGPAASLLAIRCRTLALLGKARPARRSFLKGFRLDRSPLALLPPLDVVSTGEAERLRERRVSWAKASPRLKVKPTCPTRLSVITPHDETGIELLALGDFDGDGLEDVLLEVSVDLSRGGGHHSARTLVLGTRRDAAHPIEIVKEW